MDLYTSAGTADSFFLSVHKEHIRQLLDFSWLEQFSSSQNTALQLADVFLTAVGQQWERF